MIRCLWGLHMFFVKKTSNLIVIALISGLVACGGHTPVAQPRAVTDDGGYLLSFTRVNLVDSEVKYHFQLCHQQTEAKAEEVETSTEDMEIEEQVPTAAEKIDGEGQTCFNPFEDAGGEPLVFTVLPAQGNLREKGMAGKVLRYAAGTAVVLVFGALAFVLVPKAAKLAFTKMWQLRKMALDGEADEVIRRMAQKSADKAQDKAIKKGRTFNHKQHYNQVLKEKVAAFSIFKTKLALFFTSLFIVEGTIKGWKFSYESVRDASKQLQEWNWGEKELALAEAYPFLLSNEGEPYRVASVKQLLETLRQHQQLIFSEDYLREFPPPKKEKGATELPLAW